MEAVVVEKEGGSGGGVNGCVSSVEVVVVRDVEVIGRVVFVRHLLG
jgi:hypothetical protein